MKMLTFIIIALTALQPACSAFSDPGEEEALLVNEYTATGTIAFWQDGKPAYGLTTVTIREESKEVTRDITAGTPSCFTPGCACFTLPVGTYQYSAKEAFPGTATWAGTVTLTEGCCLTVELH